MICSYLLHGYDVILILKLHRRTQLRFVLLSQFENSNDVIPCNKYEQIIPSYLLSVNDNNIQPRLIMIYCSAISDQGPRPDVNNGPGSDLNSAHILPPLPPFIKIQLE